MNCAICIDTAAGAFVKLSACSHVFHEACLGSWMSLHPTCPTCRSVGFMERIVTTAMELKQDLETSLGTCQQLCTAAKHASASGANTKRTRMMLRHRLALELIKHEELRDTARADVDYQRARVRVLRRCKKVAKELKLVRDQRDIEDRLKMVSTLAASAAARLKASQAEIKRVHELRKM